MAHPDNQQPREQWATKTDQHRTDFAPAQSPLKYQLAAWALWIAGLAVEALGTFAAFGVLCVPVLSDLPVLAVVLVLVVGLVLVLAAQSMWKKASALSHGKGRGLLGVVMTCLAYAPMCLFFLTAKNAAGPTKAAAVAASVAVVAVLAAACLLVPGDPYALVHDAV